MPIKLFLLGLPGSGKSTVARYITNYVEDRKWAAKHCGDYPFLYTMFEKDMKHKQFMPAKNGGFDMVDRTVLDIALQQLEQSIREYISKMQSTKIILIEFSRADYQHAFSQFSKAFLQDQNTYFLYLDTELAICKQRIQNRIDNPLFEDDYPVSEYLFEKYYHQDDGQLLPDFLEKTYQIDQQRVKIISNNGPLEAVTGEIEAFLHAMLGKLP
ncbi:MAG TPA: AAA family ATPase [Ktedonobacteraceae bacterium]|nr:AAA family ATPase [Ktedonobacteraceae bacterium]